MYVLHNHLLYTLFLIDDGNSTLIVASALLSVVALISLATACALGVWVWRLRHKRNQHVKTEEHKIFINEEEEEEEKDDEEEEVEKKEEKEFSPSESCPSGTLAGESVSSRSKEHDDQRPIKNPASKSPRELTGSEVYPEKVMTGEQSLEGEVNQVPGQLRSSEEAVSVSKAKQEQDFNGENCVDEEVEEHKPAPSPTSSISNEEDKKILVPNSDDEDKKRKEQK